MNEKKKIVVVAMSGGVDSSVAAALLLQQGYQVIGATMQIWDPDQSKERLANANCCSSAAVKDAQAVAAQLGIDHYVFDVSDCFKQKVVCNFHQEYLTGRTPNPCIVCNREIKFGVLLKKSLALGADFMATGHYARIIYHENRGRYLLKRALDIRKDQTYFLYTMTQGQLAHTLFPLGGHTKEEVRRMAADFGLMVAQKPESQEICFVPDNDYRSFLRDNFELDIEPGPFLDLSGNQVGIHQGIPFYTVGQRRGLGLAVGERIYVLAIDPRQNAVIVGPEQALLCRTLLAEHLNYVLVDEVTAPEKTAAQIRYNGVPAEAMLQPMAHQTVQVVFKQQQRAIAPGQAVVFYRDEYLFGGGTIRNCV